MKVSYPSSVWFMERLLGAASPSSLASFACCDSSLSTLSSPSSPPHAIQPFVGCQLSVVSWISLGMAICNVGEQISTTIGARLLLASFPGPRVWERGYVPSYLNRLASWALHSKSRRFKGAGGR